MNTCRRTVSLFSLLFLFSIFNFAQQNPPNHVNDEEPQNQPPQHIVQPEQIVPVRNTIVHALPRNPDWPNQPAWKEEDWTPWAGESSEGITNRFGNLLSAYGVLIHRVPFLHLRLPIDLNYNGIIDYHVDSKHRLSSIVGEPWKVGVW